jgi:imidazolonepropionase-like amidohydrolase
MTSVVPDGENDLFLYIANGVTTVRVMEGDATMLTWRDEIKAGTRLGPTMFVAGTPLDGADSGNRFLITHPEHVSNAAQGRRIVREQKAAGYDYIKIYNTLEPDVYRAIMNETRVENIPAVGHIPVSITLEEAIDAGQHSAEHLNPFARSVVERSGSGRWEGFFFQQRADEGAAAMAASRMWNCPTLAFYQRSEADSPESSPDLRYVSPSIQTGYTVTGSEPTTPANTRQMLRALHEAGAPIILGSWVGARFLLPGFAVVDELAALNAAGLTPFEAFQAATTNAAASTGSSAEFGGVEVGMRADLVLLEGDPLSRVRNIERKVGVMVRGRWFSERRIAERLEEIATSYGR